MAANFKHYLQGATQTELSATDILWFAGGDFDKKIKVNEYNDSTHVKTAGGTDKSDGKSPKNVKFISQSGGSGGKSQADFGTGTKDLDAMTNADATLKIAFDSDGPNVETEDAIFYTYDGTTPATPMAGTTIHACEVGDEQWSGVGGSGNPLALANQTTPAKVHNFFIAVSVKPTSLGAKSGKYFIELSFF